MTRRTNSRILQIAWLRIGGAAVGALLCTPLALAQEWTYQTISSGGVPYLLQIGNQGESVFSAYGGAEGRTVLLDAVNTNPADPEWLEILPDAPEHQSIASAKNADVQVSLSVDPDSASITGLRATVHKFTSNSQGGPDWSRELPIDIFFADSTAVAISADGQRIIAAGCTVSGVAHFYEFTPNSSSWVQEHSFQIGAPFREMRASSDALSLYLQRGTRVMVFDLVTNQLTLDINEGGHQFQGGHAISADGKTIAYSLENEIVALRLNAQGNWLETLSHPVVSTEVFCLDLELSSNGEVLAAGIQHRDILTTGILVMESLTGDVRTDYEFEGGGTYSNAVSAVAISANGAVAALSVWGDEDELVPEVSVYDTTSASSFPTSQHHLPGSAFSMDLSASGDQLVVGSKTTHMNAAGYSRGRIDRFSLGGTPPPPPPPPQGDIGDFYMEGDATLGSIVTFHFHPESEGRAYMLIASELAATPLPFGSIGTLYLKRGEIQILQYSNFQEGQEVLMQYMLPYQTSDIGSTLYFQGFSHAPRRLSEDWVQVTVQP